MTKIIVTGNGTGVGKTTVSAILITALGADYWKPIQCGTQDGSDSKAIEKLTDPSKCCIFPPAYELKHPLSPHHSAKLEGVEIDPQKVILPKTDRPLVIETAGGPLAPLTQSLLAIDLFQSWNGIWIVVSKHYLGSINHTLLTIEALKNRSLDVHHIVFNGKPNPDTEEAILHFSSVPCLGTLLPEKTLTPTKIKEYAEKWKHAFGIPIHK